MKKRAVRKDFYMEIKKSMGRFLSIFFIVALGVAFFSGIRVSEPDMRLTGDAYFDNYDLMDIKVQGTLGITQEDVSALKRMEQVAYAKPGYSVDVLLTDLDESQHVVHVESILKDMNEIIVQEGRRPEKEGECIVDIDLLESTGYEIGDVITLESGNEEGLEDTLKTTQFRIVGAGSSPVYVSLGRGTSLIGTGEVSGFAAILPDNFALEIYTEVYVQVEGAKDKVAFTEEYSSLIDEMTEQIEGIKDFRCKKRYEDIREGAESKLDDAKSDLADGRKKIEDAKKELIDGKDEIEKAKRELEDGKRESEEALNAALSEIKEGEEKIRDAKNQVASGWEQLEIGKRTLAEKEAELAKGEAQYKEGAKQLAAGREELRGKEEEYLAQANAARAALEEGKQKLEAWLTPLEEKLELLTLEIEQLKAEGKIEEAAMQQAIYDQIAEQVEAAEAAYEAQRQTVEQGLLEGASGIEAAKAVLKEHEEQLEGVRQQLEAGKEEIAKGKNNLEISRNDLIAAEDEIKINESKLAKGRIDYEVGKKEAEARLADGEQKIKEGESELEDGERELKKGEEELKEGEQKVADAEAEIAKIEMPKWYVQDRDSLPEHSSFGENADRMKAIGQVFPVLFFLVAALISLTTMTRMVEEQRTHIGTMKALGYGKRTIAGKYLKYAFLATVGGSILGGLIGEKVISYIIIIAYRIIYPHMDTMEIPYQAGYILQAGLAALACTMLATILACYKELAAQPAVLMRPPAPKQGKRIFMERIPFIWNHLSFIWKSTIRNLFRYKKRFFMTVFGIGGCMALMIVGFGLKDSIFDVGQLQYKEIQLYDATIYLRDDISLEEEEAMFAAIHREQGIQEYSRGLIKSVEGSEEKGAKDKEELYLYVYENMEQVEDFQVFRDRVSHEMYELTDDGVILTEKMAKNLNAKKGDRIWLTLDGSETEVTVTDICENYMSHYVYMTPKFYETLYKEKPEYNSVAFKMEEYDEDELYELGKTLLKEQGVLNVSYTSSVKDKLDDMLKSLNLVIVVLIVSAGMLAFVVLYNLNNINTNERRRELATLKVLGFYDGEVGAYVYRENILLTLIGGIAGIVMGKMLHGFIIVTVEVEQVMFGRNVDLSSFLYSFAFTIGFTCFVNWIMYFKLKRINMVESLKSVE